MKPRDSTLRLKRFEVAEKARKAADIETMVRDLDSMAVDLERQITTEEERTGIKDRSHFAYSTFAKSVTLRRDNLLATVVGLKERLEAARSEHDAALDELQRLEAAESGASERSRGKGERNLAAG
jgi:flagellar protein FliJ